VTLDPDSDRDSGADVRSIDLNADLAEGFGRWSFGTDEGLLRVVSSANVACGMHAGDPSVIRRAVVTAREHGVTIGAHVGYPDLQGFGRRHMDVPSGELSDLVLYQLAALAGIARTEGTRVAYVKPHGALFNRVVEDEEQAAAVARAVADFDPTLPILSLAGSAVHRAARALGVPTVNEAFADRAYLPDGRLAPRSLPGSVFHDPDVMTGRVLDLVLRGRLRAIDGTEIDVEVDSICLHGDSDVAVRTAAHIRDALVEAGVVLRAAVLPAAAVRPDPALVETTA
jgi:UPF0271 protein